MARPKRAGFQNAPATLHSHAIKSHLCASKSSRCRQTKNLHRNLLRVPDCVTATKTDGHCVADGDGLNVHEAVATVD